MAERSLPELAKETASDVKRLIQLEVRLAVEGMKRQLRSSAVYAAAGLTGVLFLVFGLLLLLVGGALALALVLPLWASFLIVGGGVILVGGGLAAAAAAGIRSSSSPVPTETREQLTEDARWLLKTSS
jgi:hypothetical protein